ncbi:MAG: indolepyruvate oxidoreductase subunit beta [Clostridiales bacterium]|nr:indolepyruvate oxidoreductase subunit beta [Clostridiales bacterium]
MNILIVGVGGQGTLLTSKVLGKYAELAGFDCKLSEVHGMAQRGGSVVTHVRFGKKVYSPIIWEGGADIILAFEKLEAFRYQNYLKESGVMVINDMEIYPMPVIIGAAVYPDTIKDSLSGKVKTAFINAAEIAIKAGNIKALNIVMVGALTKMLGFDFDKMSQAVTESVPPKFLDVNQKALLDGYNSIG